MKYVSGLMKRPTKTPEHLASEVGGLIDAKRLTIPAAARRLGVSENTMRTIVQNGEMPVLRIGGMVFLLERDVEAYLRAKYGRMLLRPRKPVGPPPLPKEVVESSLLKRGR